MARTPPRGFKSWLDLMCDFTISSTCKMGITVFHKIIVVGSTYSLFFCKTSLILLGNFSPPFFQVIRGQTPISVPGMNLRLSTNQAAWSILLAAVTGLLVSLTTQVGLVTANPGVFPRASKTKVYSLPLD